MSTPRRRILRANRTTATLEPGRQLQLEKRRGQLAWERTSLAKWMTRLKRAFHAVEKQQRRIAGLERQLARLGQSVGRQL